MKLPNLPESAADPRKPKTLWDTIITSTPVVMTVIATLLAGLSNSELTQSLVYRSQAAQNQSKAGDQWSFFQAKKLRAATASMAVEQMQISGDISSLTPESFAAAVERFNERFSEAVAGKRWPGWPGSLGVTKTKIAAMPNELKEALSTLGWVLSPIEEMPIADEHLRQVYDAVKKDPMREDSSATYGSFTDAALHDALRTADRTARVDDASLRPMSEAIKKIEEALNALSMYASHLRWATTQSSGQPRSFGPSDRQAPIELRQLAGDFSAAKLRFEAVRYDREARLNQQIAYLYEVGVRKAAWQSDRHRTRSKYFFYGMLGAQAGVLIATFSLAVRERSWMWSVAATLGVMAVSYAGYVYLFT